jgi:hypothetical protein
MKMSRPDCLSSKSWKKTKAYITLKEEQGLSARTYYRKKNVFYNRILGLG